VTTRNVLRRLTLPAAVAYVLVTVLTLLARIVVFAAALVADVAERLADAGDCARLAVHTTSASPVPTTGGTR
jgi:divalent metal cation (Fe/Co/Zn/Cd) transporter